MPENKPLTGSETKRKRPRVITYLSILAFLFSSFYWIRFSQGIIQWETLVELPLSVSPFYLVITGLIWGLSGLGLGWSLWTGRPWARNFCLIYTLIYAIYFWIDLIWVAETQTLQTRWLFNLIVTLLSLPAVYFSLNSLSSQEYFNRNPAKID